MPPQRLPDDRILELWQAFEPSSNPEWRTWATAYAHDLTWSSGLTAAQLRDPDTQRRLWSLDALGGVGSSASIDVQPLLGDPTLSDLLVEVVQRGFDPSANRRAPELQGVYDRALARVGELLDGNRPIARLQRLLHALRPGDFVCAWASNKLTAARYLLVGSRGLGDVENHVHARARLRDVLGRERTIDDHVRRSMFAFWLADQAQEVEAGHTPQLAAPPADAPAPGAPDAAAPLPTEPPLQLWPPHRQHRWLQCYPGGLETLRVVLRECLESQAPATLALTLRDELTLGGMPVRLLPSLLRDLRRLGLLEERDGRVRTTDVTDPSEPDGDGSASGGGEQLLQPGREEVLAEALVVRCRGFAHALATLATCGALPADVASGTLAAALEGQVEAERTLVLADRHLWWAEVAGLIERQPGQVRLSAQGAALARRLPDPLPRPAPLAPPPELPEARAGARPGPPAVEAMPAQALFAYFEQLERDEGLLFERRQVRELAAAWRLADAPGTHIRKRFVLLSGLSGTGKTQLLIRFAQATLDHAGLPHDQHLAVVPVRPDWRDPTGMLGYLNALHAEPTFHLEPALALVLRAAANPSLPYFLVLDEMNLAPVERWFAPFLSAMESGRPLTLHAHDAPVDGVPPTVRWPQNLRIGGTVNMDETTHAFSDKVLDRAFSFELWQVRLDAFFERRPGRTPDDEPVERALLAFQQHLVPIRRHVGYRGAGEVLDWVAMCRRLDPDAPLHELIDAALLGKVLPRVRGVDATALRDALRQLGEAADAHQLVRCAAKLREMSARLDDTGVTGFWS